MEITPEMIAAGAAVLRAWDEDCFDYGTQKAEEAAEEIFLAMIAARPA